MNAVAEPANMKVVSATLELLAKMEKMHYRNGKTSIEMSALDSRDQPIIFPIQFFSPFYEVFHEKIQELIESGICPHRLAWEVVSKTEATGARYDEEILGVGFEVCLIPLK